MGEYVERRRALGTMLGGAAALVAVCGPGPAARERAAGPSRQQDQVVVGVLTESFDRLAATQQKAAPMGELLAKEMGLKVKAFVPTDPGYTIVGLREGSLDAAFMRAVLYLRAKEDSGAQIAFRVLRPVDGTPQSTLTSVIIVRADSGLKSVAELKGKKILATDPSDSAAWVFPAAHLKKAGIDPNRDVQVTIRANGEEALVWLLQQKGDAAFAAAHDLKAASVLRQDPDAAKTLSVIATIPGAPLEVVAFRKGISGQIADKLKNALRALANPQKGTFTDKDGKQQSILGQWGIASLQDAKDSDLAALLEAAKLAGIPVGGARRS